MPNGKKGWAEGFDLMDRTLGGEGFLEKPFMDVDIKVQINIEKNAEWWMSMLDFLQVSIVEECRLDREEDKKACSLWFCGLLYLRDTNPSYLQPRIDELDHLLWTEIEGDNFWEFNPVRLSSRILWLSAVKREMAQKECTSMPAIPEVAEQSVSDQSQAIHYVTTFGRSNNYWTDIIRY